MIALKLDPNLRKEARNRRSPIATPIIPLITNILYSCWLNKGKACPCNKINMIKPTTPTMFFKRLICSVFKTLPAISKNITPQDQHNAVKIA